MFSYFEKRINPYPDGEPTTPPKGLFAFCWHYSKPAKTWIFILMGLATLGAIAEIFLFYIMAELVDWLTQSSKVNFWNNEKTTILLILAFMLILRPIINLLHELVVHQTLLPAYPMIARWQMHLYLLNQSMGFFANEFAGRVAAKVMQTALAIRESVLKIVDVFVFALVYFTSMLVMLASLDFYLMLPLVLWIIIYICIMIFLFPGLRETSNRQADARSLMTGRIVDSYTNIGIVKLFSHTGREASYAKESMDGFLKTVFAQMRLVTVLQISIFFNNTLIVVLIASIGIWQWGLDAISVGAIAAAMAVVLRLNGMSQWIMWELGGLFEQIGIIQDGMNMMTKPLNIVDAKHAKKLSVSKGQIDFENVSFHYNENHLSSTDNEDENEERKKLKPAALNNLNLTIQAGEKIGLVGRSGAGKTTLTNILLRFYDIQKGIISIDGQDIKNVTQNSLRSNIGVVTQDTSLLHRSLRDNIAYGLPEADDEAILNAAKRAKALEFIDQLEDQQGRRGLDAHVGERGVKLSGGQRQRIAIARVFLKNAPILILDEATSALDSEVEAAIQESLFDLMEGKTVIAIAHRLSTIASLDRLIVMNEGVIIENGTHEELINNKGLYSELWARQTGGFIGLDQ